MDFQLVVVIILIQWNPDKTTLGTSEKSLKFSVSVTETAENFNKFSRIPSGFSSLDFHWMNVISLNLN